MATASTIRVSTNAGTVALTGIKGARDGTTVKLLNVGSNSLILSHNHAGSSSGNKFLCADNADVTLRAHGSVTMTYSATDGYWFVSGV